MKHITRIHCMEPMIKKSNLLTLMDTTFSFTLFILSNLASIPPYIPLFCSGPLPHIQESRPHHHVADPPRSYSEWYVCIPRWTQIFVSGTSSARNENLRPLLNTNIPLISVKYGPRDYFSPLESRFLMRKSEKKGPVLKKSSVPDFTCLESSCNFRKIG